LDQQQDQPERLPMQRWQSLLGGVLGAAIGYMIGGIFFLVWGGIGGLFIGHVFRVKEGRVIVDRVALNLWVKGDRSQRPQFLDADLLTVGRAVRNGMVRMKATVWSGMTRMKTTFGTVLLVLGIGIIAASLPNALRNVFQQSQDYGGYDGLPMALGAMMIASGWFLRRPSTG
jgi:hypothetical protein